MAIESQLIHYAISGEVFSHFPAYMRGVVLAEGVSNKPSPDDLVHLLREAEADIRRVFADQDITTHAHMTSWREAYRSLDIKPSEYRPSMEAMIRRVINGHDLPSINALVDIGNIVSLRHLLPVGGHAIDVLTGDIMLRPANGQESFIPFGSEQVEHPEIGEFIFTEGDIVLTRRWTWRQSTHTLTSLATTAIEFNVDALPPVTATDTVNACTDIVELVNMFCGGESSTHMLSQHNPRIRIR